MSDKPKCGSIVAILVKVALEEIGHFAAPKICILDTMDRATPLEKDRRPARLPAILAMAFVVTGFLGRCDVSSAQKTPETAWPDPVVLTDGSLVRDSTEFGLKRRPEILGLFEENVFGRTTTASVPIHVVQNCFGHHLEPAPVLGFMLSD